MGKILNENEAAFKLGITKELLFAYVRYAPKKCLGHNRKLISEIKDGQNFFDEEELERFDTYLKEPWSIPDAPRPEIPKYIQDYLKVEVGGKCPISGKGYPLENAHITPYTECRNHYHHNLIRISKEEHTKIDTGVIDRDILQKIKQALINKIRQKLFEKEKQDAFTKDIPLPHPLYVGKFHKLLELTSTMETEKFIVIEGLGGIGKTQLVLNAIDNVKYHNPVIWIEIESKHSLDELCIELTNKITPFVNSNVENIISSLRNLQITIILDSIENLLIYEKESTEEFLETLLTQTQNVQLIITSQIDLSSIDYPKTIIFPEPLDRNWGIELFKSLLEEQIDVSDSDFDWLIKFCSGHPLAIKLVVSLLKFYKSSKQTIKRIKEVGNIELPQKKVHNKKTSFDICLATVYESLTDNQVKILQYCKYFPAGVNQDLLKDTVRVDNYDEDVASLKNLFMIESQEDIFFEFERLIIPSSIRPFLRTKSSNMSPQKELIIQKDIITYLMMEAVIIDTKYIERQEYGSATAGIARMESELPNLMEAMRLAKKNLIYFKTENNKKELLDYLFFIAAISASLGKYCFTRGHYDYGIFFSKIGLDANRELGKEQEISMQYMYLTQIQSRQFDIEGFSQTIKEFLEFAETTDNLIVKANASWAKARFEFDKSLYVESLASYDKTLEIMSHIYQEQEAEQDSDEFDSEQHEGNIAIIKFERAKVFEFTGKYEEAIAQYMDAIKIFEKLNDEINLTSYYHHIAHCLCKIDNFEEGINYYSKAIQGFIDFGQMDYLINSVTDIGRFIEKRPEIVNLEILDEQLLSSTIDRIIYQLKNVITRELKLNKSLDFILKEIPFNLIGNMVLLIQVIGLSFHRFLLTESLDDFAHEIGIKKMKFELFPAIVNLGHAIGGVDEWKTNKEIKQAVINSILQSCLIINGGPDLQSKSRIFYWLAIWVQVTGLEKEATAENLFKQAWDSLPEL